MGVRGGGRLIPLAFAVLVCVLFAPTRAAAATVVNGDFESGTLKGWSVHGATQGGNWFAYKGQTEPIAKRRSRLFPPEPPQGVYAAIADQVSPHTLVLSQEVALEPGSTHFLSLLAYYRSSVLIAVPAPDTLSVDDEVLSGRANQQFRIDVMRPGTPIESIDPADILLTVFQTRQGDPQAMAPTQMTADISALAGQTVRLRMAVAAHEELLTAGVDAVSISPKPPGQGALAPRFRLGKAKANRKNGTVTLPVQVPGPGLVTARGPGSGPSAGTSKVKKPSKLVQPAKARARAPGTVKLLLKPTASALSTLRQKHKLRVRVTVTYAPSAASPETATVPVVFKLQPRPGQRR
jgi:hypothetical protein